MHSSKLKQSGAHHGGRWPVLAGVVICQGVTNYTFFLKSDYKLIYLFNSRR